MACIALSACAETLLAGVDPTPPLGQHMPRHVLLPIFRHQQRDMFATKERHACDNMTPTQKEITMKKLLAIKERPADGGQDAHEKGDSRKKHCLFAIFAHTIVARY